MGRGGVEDGWSKGGDRNSGSKPPDSQGMVIEGGLLGGLGRVD